jgi:hypothetical protein
MADPLLNVLLHYGLTMNQVKSELIGLVPANEIVVAAEQLHLDAIIIFSDACSSLGEFQRELIQVAQKTNLPVIVSGKLASALDTSFPRHVHLIYEPGQQALLDKLNDIFPGESDISGVK